MSYKTDRLVALLPDAYAAHDRESLLFKLLDSFGAELLQADDALKALLKSHWVDYASGPALDGLGAIYGVSRRQLRTGGLESDGAFRLRLRSVVRLFTGGGTVRAVVGAVRSALGMPFDLDDLRLPPGFEELRADLERLVVLEEFSPTSVRFASTALTERDGASQIGLEVDLSSVRPVPPVIVWQFTLGGGRRLRLEALGAGVQASDDFVLPEGGRLRLSAEADGQLAATLDGVSVTAAFTNLDGSRPPRLPEVPPGRSTWTFSATGGLFDVSSFDGADSFDLPVFQVEMLLLTPKPLTFDVYVPYDFDRVVEDLLRLRGYNGPVLAFKGLPRERIQEVVDQTRAAGVRGNVHFTLNFFDSHAQADGLRLAGDFLGREDAGASDALVAGSVNELAEQHDQSERLLLGGVFDIGTFDTNFAFL
jgi:hypothetical protein